MNINGRLKGMEEKYDGECGKNSERKGGWQKLDRAMGRRRWVVEEVLTRGWASSSDYAGTGTIAGEL